MYIVGRSKILHKLCTTTNIKVGIVRHRVIFKQSLLPVYIRITFSLLNSSLITIIIDERLGTDVFP